MHGRTIKAMEQSKVTVIINPVSGISDKHDIPNIINTMLDRRRFVFKTVFTEYAGHASEIAANCVTDGQDAVIAVGGDGTINEVARSIINTDTALGIIPCGSGNGLARHLMLPLDALGAIDVINRYEVHDLDYGIINGHPFFCTCGMGFDAFISMKFAESGKRGPLTYLQRVLEEGLRYKPESYEITGDDMEKTYKAFLVTCANASQYGNNAYIAPHASMSDGLLDVIIMEPFDILDAPQVGIDMLNKTLDKNTKIKTFQAKHIHIKRQKEGYIHFDGDPMMSDKDVDIRVVSKGIKMIVNPDADKSKRKPNMVQAAFSDFFNDLGSIKDDITRQRRRLQALNRLLLSRLNLY